MDFHLWLSLVIICVLGALSPGPSLALVVKNTINGGINQGYATAISHGFGVACYAALTAIGIAEVIAKSPTMFSILRYLGAAFLLFLGIRALLSTQNKTGFTNEINTSLSTSVEGWRDGFLIALFNPKLMIFFLALFSQFVGEQTSVQQKMIMVSTVGGIDMIWYLLVVFLLSKGSSIQKLKKRQRLVDLITGFVFILLALRIAWI